MQRLASTRALRAMILAAGGLLSAAGCGAEFTTSETTTGSTTGAGGATTSTTGATTGTTGSTTGTTGAGGSTTGTGGSQGTGGQGGCDGPAQCNDGDACTQDLCEGGQCKHPLVAVDDNDPCTVDACMGGAVTHVPVAVDDGNACTFDSCDAGGEISHKPVDPDDKNPCTMDACDPGVGVTHQPTPLDDGNACTFDTCNPMTGIHHFPVDVNDNNPCTMDACDPGVGVTHTLINIDDNNPCTADSCDPMGGVQHAPINVDDNNPCTKDSCDPPAGVQHTPVVCNDNNVCTTDTCNPVTGACVFTPAVYFAEAFADNAKGWTLDPSWQIGATMVSVGQVNGTNPDPAFDHTPTVDNGVAGVVLGGNIPMPANFPGPVRWLTSPVINLGNVNGSVYLKLWRWLNIDTPPYMQAYIEVYDGTTWVNLWSSNAIVADNAWVSTPNAPDPTNFEVTAYKSANFRLRIGYQVKQAGAYTVSGWNVDDILLVPAANCQFVNPGGP